jgi:hypothetical protein
MLKSVERRVKMSNETMRMMVGALTVLGVASIAAIAYSVVLAVHSMQLDYDNHKSESRCIQAYIDKGVERSRIVRDSGVCYVEE